MKSFIVTCIGSIGCTFLEWSIHYLTGQSQYYNTEFGSVPLPDSPLTTVNAHNHRKNHPFGFREFSAAWDKLESQTDTNLISCYPNITIFNPVLRSSHDIRNIIFDKKNIENLVGITQEHLIDIKKIFTKCKDKKIPVIWVDMPDNISVYKLINTRSRPTSIIESKEISSFTESYQEFINIFFSDSKNKFSKDFPIWELRELMALNLPDLVHKPRSSEILSEIYTDQTYIVPITSLWHNGEKLLTELIDYLDLKIDKSRVDHWQKIYKEWQTIQVDTSIEFIYNIETITESIVKNYSLDLTRFNLDLIKEVVIQSQLIHNHNLTLKNWQLEKFPCNAQDLHKLLEPCFYNCKN